MKKIYLVYKVWDTYNLRMSCVSNYGHDSLELAEKEMAAQPSGEYLIKEIYIVE